ncbi:hypothetical protein [Pseudorhizobium flavum]|uniref:Uncharacterized protein n=1 Tax=Pseudorhizobium flavum TaxID=1335061 RepID=A0A7W9YYV5_9HYPH|nr:hypothetical protein [Pseudorhizobium flavum]MBB6180787.1 hypothetical protein [Pseudorhizobium flavum]CAD6615133.1 hypothetical protein RFYW14_02802 [Pseudorhizobium flavum]
MARRRASPADVSGIATSTDLQRDSEFPLRVYSPRHSHPGRSKHFDLSILEGTGELGHVLAREFLEFASSFKEETADAYLVAIRSLFRSCVAQLIHQGAQLPSITASQWRHFAALWFYDLKAEDTVSDVTANGYLSANRRFFLHLQKRFLVPKFRWPNAIRGALSKPRPSVSNAPVRNVVASEVGSWSKPDRTAWSELAKLNDLSSPSVVKRRNAIILAAARRHAELEIRKWWQLYRESRVIAAQNSSFDFDGYCRKYEYVSDGILKRTRGWRKPLRTLPNFLVYVERKFGGVMPGKGDDPDFVKCAYAHHADNLKGRFHLEYGSLLPLLTIIFIERPKMNLASPLSMTTEDVEQISRNEHQARWTKGRANYRRLSDDMPTGSQLSLLPNAAEDITAAQALLVIQELSKPLRAKAILGADKHLCLVRDTANGCVVGKPAAQSWICKQWRAFRDRSGLMSAIDFTLSQFRPTGAVTEFFETGDIFKVADRLGQKSISVTARYIHNLAADTMDAGDVRQVQDSLTVAVAQRSGRPLDQLGISPEREKHIRETAFSSGFLGYNISGTSKEAQEKESVLESILSGSKFVIIETAEIAAEIIAFNEHIITKGKAIQGTARYEEFWLPLVVICTQIIKSMSVSVIRDAKKRLRERPIHYGPVV